MSTQKAVIVTEPKTAGLVGSRAIPKLPDDYILVKTVSVGLNPTDWRYIDFLSPPGVLLGSDYSGVVEAVGKDVKLPWKKGGRICGSTHGGNAVQAEDGAFASDKALSTEGGEYLSILPAKIDRANVNNRFILFYTSLGEAFNFGDMPFPAKPEDFEHAKKFTQVAQDLLDQGNIKVHPPRVGKDGLRGVLEGIELLRTNKVSGEKLVYNVEETP
ncbi:chaperonin 10-like protein [Aspergillus germanicus]